MKKEQKKRLTDYEESQRARMATMYVPDSTKSDVIRELNEGKK